MTLTVFTALNTTRRIVHDQGYTRSRLHAASRHEETTGDAEERLKITAYLQKDIQRAERSISDTRQAAIRYQRAAAILRGAQSVSDDPLHSACADLHRMDAQQAAQLADQLDRVDRQANEAAERAADRLAKADMSLRTTAALAAYLAKLAQRNFKPDKSTERDRQNYLALKRMSQ
ncbi:hypothetical protein [Ruegeria arenilitoris]|uniref:hypothetical protein n=1 Tax=Ruegeria arenilitoris TaxID=1173585 RepID=UPI00148195B6|nr:hypothetical protein [Ruegeria arenilitoris]